MEELSAEEQAQFKEMEKQEAEEKVILEKEKEVEKTAEPEPKPEQKEVPLAALQEERERRKTAEANARQAELNQARLDERLKAINERLAPPQTSREIPDPEKDALGALKATAEEVRAFREFRENQAQQQQRNNYAMDVMGRAQNAEAEFMKATPDYGEASVFLKNARADELSILGKSPFEISQILSQEGLLLADAALRQGKNPAEMVYNLAKTKGYNKSQTQVVQAQPEGDAEKLARIAAGQKANTSLGNLNATPPKPALSGKDLLAMDDEQFEKWLEKLPMKERAKYLGT
jgi:hypothetical protein